MVKLICRSHNHALAKSFIGHSYASQLNDDEKIIIGDMTKSLVKPKNILLTLKEHNANICTIMKYAYRSSIRDSNSEMQQLMKLLDRDQYIHWHRLKDEDVVCDIFWSHPDAVKITNACNLVFLMDNTYKTNRYRLPLLDIVGVTPIGIIFSIAFAYLEGERINNVVWALERFRGIFLRRDVIPQVIATDKNPALMNAVKTVFLEPTNLFGSLVNCPSEQEFNDCLMKFEIACLLWPMFVDYVKQTWLIPHKQRFVKALKKLLHNSLGDLCSVWEAMNNMITLQHTKSKTSFETSTHVVGHIFKVTLYKRLIGMVSRYFVEFERVNYVGIDNSRYGCRRRTAHDLPCACELVRYVLGSIPLETIPMFWRRLSFSDQGLFDLEVSRTEEIEAISKRFEELDVCGKVTLKSKLREIDYPDLNSMWALSEKGQNRRCSKETDD
ncbi:Protein FAR1-RELATED SEQUENCE 5 [Glycine max]|nr:Protein FAR1-RELATED SEQUENCE 5 [Glycine max]